VEEEVVVEVVQVGLHPQGILQVGEGVDLLLRLFLLHFVYLHFLPHCPSPGCLLLMAVVEGAAGFHLARNLGLYPGHYPLLLILLPLMPDRCPFLLGNYRISLCPWANDQSHHTPCNVY
jgi:hypothetical protein